MPKKYKQKSLLTKPTSSTPSSLSLSKASSSQNAPTTRTVNDLIQESRRGTGNERPAAITTISSIPPSLRAVLDLPAPPAPAPRVGLRGPTRLRRIPGPPPPRSWLADSIHAPREVRDIPWSRAHERSRVQKQSSKLPEGNFPSEKSLQHSVLKHMGTNWLWHAEYDHEYLAELPAKIKQSLLSYIAIYNEGQGPDPLRLLFPRDLTRDEDNEIRRLDLGNAIGGWSTLKKIERELEGEISAVQKNKLIPLGEEDIPDSWDEGDTKESYPIPQMTSASNMRFSNLKHLSLAIAPGTDGSSASWTALLALSTRLSTITSLSLAYWPQPTYTPNASTSMVKIGNPNSTTTPSITYGGTNFYSAFDNDWREAAGMLRTLSRSLYCLEWLDLTGCGNWYPALAWEASSSKDENVPKASGPDWNGSWRGIEHLILAVGWSPGPAPEQTSLTTLMPTDAAHMAWVDYDDTQERVSTILTQLSSTRLGSRQPTDNVQPESWNVEFEREKYYHRQEVTQFKEICSSAKAVARKLRASRKQSGGKWIEIDFGTEDDIRT